MAGKISTGKTQVSLPPIIPATEQLYRDTLARIQTHRSMPAQSSQCERYTERKKRRLRQCCQKKESLEPRKKLRERLQVANKRGVLAPISLDSTFFRSTIASRISLKEMAYDPSLVPVDWEDEEEEEAEFKED